MGMITLMVTVTLDKQPEISQREVRTGTAATPEEFEAILEVRLPGERGLVRSCWGSSARLPACSQPGTAHTLCLPRATLQRFLGGSMHP